MTYICLCLALLFILFGSSQFIFAQNSFINKDKLPIKYLGHRFNKKFHRPNCIFAQIMSKSNKLSFNFRKDAVYAGMSPCKYCLPRVWTMVQGSILVSPVVNDKILKDLSTIDLTKINITEEKE